MTTDLNPTIDVIAVHTAFQRHARAIQQLVSNAHSIYVQVDDVCVVCIRVVTGKLLVMCYRPKSTVAAYYQYDQSGWWCKSEHRRVGSTCDAIVDALERLKV